MKQASESSFIWVRTAYSRTVIWLNRIDHSLFISKRGSMRKSRYCLKETVVYYLPLYNPHVVKIAASPPPNVFRSGGHQHAQRVMMSKSYFMVNVWLELEASRRSDSHTDSQTILAGSLCSSVHCGADGTSLSLSLLHSDTLSLCMSQCLMPSLCLHSLQHPWHLLWDGCTCKNTHTHIHTKGQWHTLPLIKKNTPKGILLHASSPIKAISWKEITSVSCI